jgi:hypothetical protein
MSAAPALTSSPSLHDMDLTSINTHPYTRHGWRAGSQRPRARGQYAIVGIGRRSGQELPGFGSASASEGPSVGRSSIRFWLEQVHWFRGAQCLYRKLWSLGAAEALLKTFGFNVENVMAAAKSQIALHSAGVQRSAIVSN